MLTPSEKFLLPKKFSPEKDRTHNAASSRTASPTHYQKQTIPAPVELTKRSLRNSGSHFLDCKQNVKHTKYTADGLTVML